MEHRFGVAPITSVGDQEPRKGRNTRKEFWLLSCHSCVSWFPPKNGGSLVDSKRHRVLMTAFRDWSVHELDVSRHVHKRSFATDHDACRGTWQRRRCLTREMCLPPRSGFDTLCRLDSNGEGTRRIRSEQIVGPEHAIGSVGNGTPCARARSTWSFVTTASGHRLPGRGHRTTRPP